MSRESVTTIEQIQRDALASKSAREQALEDALLKAEEADIFHANCDECGGEGEPEACGKCFPLADDARIARRAALASQKPTDDGGVR